MIAGSWLAFASALFAVMGFGLWRFGKHLGVVGWHYNQAIRASTLARDGFALCAVVALVWHLIH